MSFALLRPGAIRVCALSFVQPRCALQLKSSGIEYYWPDHPYEKTHEKPSFFDRPQYHLNENSKSICVEGNVAIGKGTFARNLADTLYLRYMPPVTDDDFFIDKNYEPHLDYRDYNAILPERFQFYTTEMLFSDKDPIHHGKPLYVQQNYYMYRALSWWRGCAHVFLTGQGFVSNRSPFSSYVFAKAMSECGLMSADAKDWLLYYDKYVTPAMMYPHLVVYLRSPVSMSRANLDKRRLPWEAGVTDKFLEVVKQVYESDYLPKISRHSEVFTIDAEDYNFSDANDVTYLAEQLCKLDLEQKHLSTDVDQKLVQWRQATYNREELFVHRERYSSLRPIIDCILGVTVPDDMPEGGLTIPEAYKVMQMLKRDPRQDAWSSNRPWDSKSLVDTMLGNTRTDPTGISYCFDADPLKVMAYYRSFGYYKRLTKPVFRSD